MPNDPILSLLGLCRKAGKLEIGEEPVGASCRARQAKLILLASDAASNTCRRAAHFGEAGNVLSLQLPFAKDELGFQLGRTSCAMLALTDSGFAARIVEKLAERYPERYTTAAEQLRIKADRVLARQQEQRRHEKKLREGKNKPWAPPAKGQPPASGKAPYKGSPSGDGKAPYKPRTSGDGPYKPRTSGDGPYKPRPSGDGPYKPRPSGDGPYKSRPSGDGPYKPRPSGDGPYKPRPSGDGPYKSRPSGDGPYKPRPSGDGPYKSRPSGDGPYKPRPSGDGKGPYQPRPSGDGKGPYKTRTSAGGNGSRPQKRLSEEATPPYRSSGSDRPHRASHTGKPTTFKGGPRPDFSHKPGPGGKKLTARSGTIPKK